MRIRALLPALLLPLSACTDELPTAAPDEVLVFVQMADQDLLVAKDGRQMQITGLRFHLAHPTLAGAEPRQVYRSLFTFEDDEAQVWASWSPPPAQEEASLESAFELVEDEGYSLIIQGVLLASFEDGALDYQGFEVVLPWRMDFDVDSPWAESGERYRLLLDPGAWFFDHRTVDFVLDPARHAGLVDPSSERGAALKARILQQLAIERF